MSLWVITNLCRPEHDLRFVGALWWPIVIGTGGLENWFACLVCLRTLALLVVTQLADTSNWIHDTSDIQSKEFTMLCGMLHL